MATRLNYNGNMILDHFTLGKRPLPIDGRPKIGRLINKKGEKLFAPMENETIEVEITEPVFIDPENKRVNQ